MTYRYKRDANDNIIERKARCAVRGDLMTPHTHFDPSSTKTFAADKRTIRILLCHASANKYPLEHFDITSAYLHEPFNHHTPVYIRQNPLFDGTFAHPEPAGLLQKNLYGTKKGGRIFCEGTKEFLTSHGFHQTKSDPCCFVRFDNESFVLIATTIDDFLACASDQHLLDDLYALLRTKYTVKRLCFPTKYLNWHVTQTPSGFHLSQPHIPRALITKTKMQDAKPLTTLYSDGIDLSPPSPDENEDDTIAKTYREVLRELRYLTDCTRPDLQYFINALARAAHKLTQRHWRHLKRLIRFLKHTPNCGIALPNQPQKDPLKSYADADFANDKQTRKSISGSVHTFHGAPVHWSSQRQSLVALSTCDAEFISLSDTIRQTNWLRGLLQELHIIPNNHSITTYTDSHSALQVASQTAPTKRRKFIDIRFHHIIDNISQGHIKLIYTPTVKMLADIFTKPLTNRPFSRITSNLRLTDPPPPNNTYNKPTAPWRQGECQDANKDKQSPKASGRCQSGYQQWTAVQTAGATDARRDI